MSFFESRMYSRPASVPKMPVGLVELMEGLTKDVLKNNAADVYEYCANHMQRLLEIRDGSSNKKVLSLEQKIKKAQEKVRQRSELRWKKYKADLEEKAQPDDITIIEVPKNVITLESTILSDNLKILKPVYHDHDLTNTSEIEISCESGCVNASLDEKDFLPTQGDTNQKSEVCEMSESKGTIIKNEIEEGGKNGNHNGHENTAVVSIDESFKNTTGPLVDFKEDNEVKIQKLDKDQAEKLLKKETHECESNDIKTNSLTDTESKPSKEILPNNDDCINPTELSAKDEASNLNLKAENVSIISDLNSGKPTILTDYDSKDTIGIFETTRKTSDIIDKESEKDVLNNSNEKENVICTELPDNCSKDIIISDFIIKYNNTLDVDTNGNNSITLTVNEMVHEIKQNNNIELASNKNELMTDDTEEVDKKTVTDRIEIKIDSKTTNIDVDDKSPEQVPEVARETEISLKSPNVAVTEILIDNIENMNEETVIEKTSAYLTTTVIEDDNRKLVNDDSKESFFNNSINVDSDSISVIETTNLEPVLTLFNNSESGSSKVQTANENTPDMINIDKVNEALNENLTNIQVSNTFSVQDERPLETRTGVPQDCNNTLIGTVRDFVKAEVTSTVNNENEVSIERNDLHAETLETGQNDIDTSVNLVRSSGDDSLTEESNSIIEGFVTDHSDDMVLNDSGNTMDLETAAVTIQKVFRNFLFKSRASTFEDSTNDDHNLSYEDNDEDKKDKESFISPTINKDRRTLGISRMDTVLQTVNEEKSLSLSTDDSSTLSSAATIIQAHVRGFLVRNKLNSGRTTSSNNSLLNSDGPSTTSLEDADKNKNKTILNIHIVPEGGNFLSRDESIITSMDLSLEGSPPSSVNLHPSYDKTNERRKQLKREDAIQSISPPSNNSGKLSEDVESVKELSVKGEAEANTSLEQDAATVTLLKGTSQDTEIESFVTTPTNSLTVDTVVEEHTSNTANIFSSPEPTDLKTPSLTKQSSDEMDVITPFKENNTVKESDTAPKLLHSGEFHDTILPTKVSRKDTPVVSEFKNVLVYFLIWNH